MSDSRGYFGMTAVATGGTTYILAAGGYGSCSGGTCNEAERYDESAGTWGSAGTMSYDRVLPALELLTDGSGKALVSGGWDSTGALPTAERYTPSTNSWATTGNMTTGRYGHVSAALSSASSSRVLAAGGRDTAGSFLSSAERYTPSTGAWSSAGTMSIARYGATATRIASDFVVVVGGQYTGSSCIRRAQRYNPGSTPTWTTIATVPGSQGLCYHAASLLDDGSVLVSGGLDGPTGTVLDDAYTYNAVADAWTTRPSLATERAGHTSTRYASSPVGKVLVAGGSDGSSCLSGEFYTP